MSETALKQESCTVCGSEIRDNALFCYHCGSSVEASDEPIPMPEAAPVQKKRGRRRRPKVSNDLEENSIEESEDDQPRSSDIESASNGSGELALKSAAAIRNKARRVEPKRVEIYWEEHESAPNSWFLFVSLGIVVFSVVIFIIAMYLK